MLGRLKRSRKAENNKKSKRRRSLHSRGVAFCGSRCGARPSSARSNLKISQEIIPAFTLEGSRRHVLNSDKCDETSLSNSGRDSSRQKPEGDLGGQWIQFLPTKLTSPRPEPYGTPTGLPHGKAPVIVNELEDTALKNRVKMAKATATTTTPRKMPPILVSRHQTMFAPL